MTLGALEESRRLHLGGRKVVAVVGWRVPREPMLAGNVHTVQITPDLDAATPIADELLSSDSGPELRALFETIASGALGFAQLIVIAPPYAALSVAIEDLRRAGLLREQVPPTFFFEVLVSREAESRLFLTDRIRDLVVRLKSLGLTISSADLQQAVRRSNGARREVAGLLEDRGRFNGSSVIAKIAAGASMDPEAHTALLRSDDAPRVPAASTRVLICSSSVLYDDRLHRLVEACGGQVLGEDDINGSCHALGQVDESGDPIEALGAFFFENQPPQHTAPGDVRLRWVLERSRAADVDGVVFYAEDPTWGWDLPALRTALQANGKRSMLIAQDVRTQKGADAAYRSLSEFLQANRGATTQ